MAANPYTVPALPVTITAANNVINVYYVKDESQTKELSYTVEYYLDGVFKETQTVTKTVWINAVVLAVDTLDANRYVGYVLDSTVPAVWPTVTAAGSVFKAYYAKENTDETITLTNISWNNGNGNGNGGGINQFSVNGTTLKSNTNYMTPANFDGAIKKAPQNGVTAIYTVDDIVTKNSGYEKVYYVRVALFDSMNGIWKVYAGTATVDNPGGNNNNQQAVLTRIF
jgi:hypothetical protein